MFVTSGRRVGAGIAVLVISCLALGAGGCGAERDERDERAAVRSAYEQIQRSFAKHDRRAVCAAISRKARRQVGFLGHEKPTLCRFDVGDLFKWIDSSGARRALNVTVMGDTATVTYRLDAKTRGRIPFVREDGSWKLDNFFSTTAPPAPDLE